MAKKISKYIISLLLLLAFIAPQPIQAQQRNNRQASQQQKKKREKTLPEVTYPLMNGIDVGVDVLGPVLKVFGSDFMSAEAMVDVNLYNRYFPTVEVGFGGGKAINDYDVSIKSSAPYFRLGIDYNTFWKKAHGNLLLVGLRYGFSTGKYDVVVPDMTNPEYTDGATQTNLTDHIWGDTSNYVHEGMSHTMHWVEFTLGLRANVAKRIKMGLMLRIKYKLKASVDKYGDPYYIPGFGRYDSNNTGITYSIIYQLK
ncbi:MAG: hypothetical protein IKP48_11235 [Bacteroidaceae bacterium]|nr:hypothetical protein [Bacteroidaceae bacterium]